MIWIELLGWVGAGMTLAAYSMRTMLPLRIAALLANVFFGTYGGLTETYPMLVLHVVLFPLNVWRLVQLLRDMRLARASGHSGTGFEWIARYSPPEPVAAGTVLFRKGDPADRVFYIASGHVSLDHAGKSLGPGTLFGEIAFFTDDGQRTDTATCEEDCALSFLDEKDFMRLYYQSPSFGMAVVRLMARRLLENAGHRDSAAEPRG